MENITMNLQELTEGWEKLLIELNRAKRFQMETFRKYFLDTYKVLKNDLEETKIEKSHVPLVAKAFLFANAQCKDVDARFRAALVLTERMLSSCVLDPYARSAEGTYVYILEVRKEIFIRFEDVDGALEKLEKSLNEKVWEAL